MHQLSNNPGKNAYNIIINMRLIFKHFQHIYCQFHINQNNKMLML